MEQATRLQQQLDKIAYSLNCLEVKGKNNLDILLGCILALEQLKESLNEDKDKGDES